MSLRKYFLLICTVIVLISCTVADLPNYVKKCRVGDKECLFQNIHSVLTKASEGDASFGLEPIDPIDIGTLDIQQDVTSPVNINLKFKNTKLEGGRTVRVVKSKGFGNAPDGRHDLLLKAPQFILRADYVVNGKVLVLPVQGEGLTNLTFNDVQIKLSIFGKSMEKYGKIYMDVEKTELYFDVGNAKYYFANLFKGDKDLGENINIFINDNWRAIFNEMRPAFTKAFNEHLYKIVKSVFTKTPYNEMFETLSKDKSN